MKIRLINYLETTHPGGINMIMRGIAKNISDMDHESIVLQPNPANLPDEEIYEGFKIIRISSHWIIISHNIMMYLHAIGLVKFHEYP